jgi:hypothetical protein
MKLSRRGKSARRGRHTKRAGKHHTRRIKHRAKQYKRTYRKNNRKLKHNKRVQYGGVFKWTPPVETNDQNSVSTSTIDPVLLTYRKQKYGNNLKLEDATMMEESKYCSAQLTFTPIGYTANHQLEMVFTLSLKRYEKNKAGPIDKYFVCEFTLHPVYNNDTGVFEYHYFSTDCISMLESVHVDSNGDITKPGPLPKEFVLDGADTADTKSKTKYKFYDQRERTGDFFFRDLFTKISKIYIGEFNEFVIKDKKSRIAEEQEIEEKKIARERQIRQKVPEIQTTPEYTLFKSELELKAQEIKDEPDNLNNTEISEKIDVIVEEILKQQLTLLVKESLFPDENLNSIMETISGLQSQLEKLSPALVKEKNDISSVNRKGIALMSERIGSDAHSTGASADDAATSATGSTGISPYPTNDTDLSQRQIPYTPPKDQECTDAMIEARIC